MSIKQFRAILEGIIERSERFVIYDNRDKNFENLEDNEIALAGKDENEIFAITIIKCK